MTRLIYIAAFLLAVPANGAHWYVSPLGDGNKSGTSPSNAADMFALNAFAIENVYGIHGDTLEIYGPYDVPARTISGVQPGDTIWMLPGYYYAPQQRNSSGVALKENRYFLPHYIGTAANPVTIRAEEPWLTFFDGNFKFFAANESGGGSVFIVVRDITFINSDPWRVGLGFDRPSITAVGTPVHFINNIMGYGGSGGGIYYGPMDPDNAFQVGQSMDSSFSGNIVFSSGIWQTNGIYTPQAPFVRGSGTYFQNEVGRRTVSQNILFFHNTTSLKLYGVTGPPRNALYSENTAFYSGALGPNGDGKTAGGRQEALLFVGSDSTPAEDVEWDRNIAFQRQISKEGEAMTMSWGGRGSNIKITNNELIRAGRTLLSHIGVNYLTFTNNRIVNVGGDFFVRSFVSEVQSNAGALWDYNTYHGTDSNTQWPDPFTGVRQGFSLNDTNYSYSTWLTLTGYDSNSIFTESQPSDMRVYVRTNAFNPNRRDVVIVNFSGATTYNLNPAALGFSAGGIVVRDPVNIIGRTGTWTNSNWSLNSITNLPNWNGTDEIPISLTRTNSVPKITDEFSDVTYRKVHEHPNVRHPGVLNVLIVEATESGGSPVDPVASLEPIDLSATESGPTTATFRLNLNAPPTEELTVALSIAGTATSADYTLDGMTGTNVVMGVGQTSQLITLTPVAGDGAEGDETVTFTLVDGDGYSVTGSGLTVTIQDDAATAEFSISTQQDGAEINDSATMPIQFLVTRSNGSGAAVVSYTLSGTATEGVDYAEVLGQTITFDDGSTSEVLELAVANDELSESTETVIITLDAVDSGLGSIGSPSSATAQISDADSAGQTSVSAVALSQPTSESGSVSVQFRRGGDLNSALVVYFDLSGTATVTNDFTLSGATLHSGTIYTATIPADSDTTTISVTVVDDEVTEASETVVITVASDLSGDNLYQPDSEQGAATITIPASDLTGTSATVTTLNAQSLILE